MTHEAKAPVSLETTANVPVPLAFPPAPRPRRSPWRIALIVGAAAVVGIVGLVALVLVGVRAALRSSDAYEASLEYVQSQPEVIARLGRPVSDHSMPMGNVKLNGSFGTAQLSIPIKGPKGSGTALTTLHKDGVRWSIDSAKVAIGSEVVVLIEGPTLATSSNTF